MTRSPLSLAAVLALAAFAQGAHAQSAPPTAGDVLRQATPPAPAVPAATPALPRVGGAAIEPPMTALPQGGPGAPVSSIAIVGNRVIDTATLQALVADQAGRTLTLAQMEELATRVTRYYRTQGYFVARAYVPAQDLTDGRLTLRVVEGNYGRFVLSNQSIVRDDVVQGLLDDIKDRDIVSLDTLERAMLIINDTPGVKVVKADVMPGQQVGTSDFAIGTEATPRYDGFVLADNYGSRYTGRERLSFGANWNSPTGRGDRLGISGLASANGDLLNARVAYSTLVATNGTRVEGAVGRTTYSLGDAYESLDATGTADSVELTLTTPYKRTRNASVYLGLGLAHRDLRDEVGAADTSTRKSSDALSLRASGSFTHRVLGLDGLSQLDAAVTAGHLRFHDDDAAALDGAGARTAGDWAKLTASAVRITLLPQQFSLTTSARAQMVLNGRNLDGSERLTVSGMGGVAAYPIGELAGDDAFVARAELARPLATVQGVQLSGNVFTSWGFARAADPVGDSGRARQIADAGVGLSAQHGMSLVRLTLATRLHGGEPTSESADHTRFLVQAGLSF